MAQPAVSKVTAPTKRTRRYRRMKVFKAGSKGAAEALILPDSELALIKQVLARHRGIKFGLIPTTLDAAKALSALGGSFVSVTPTAHANAIGYPSPARAAFEPNAKAKVLALGLKQRQEDLRRAGGAFDLDEVRELMYGVTSQAVGKRVREGSILAVPGPSNRRRYPAAQFTSDGAIAPGLKAVTKAFPSKSPWMLLNFLVNPDPRLGDRKPFDLLKSGEVDIVVEAARRFGQQGA